MRKILLRFGQIFLYQIRFCIALMRRLPKYGIYHKERVNSTLTATLSDKTFRLFDKLESPVFRQFVNNFNLATTFYDGDDNHYVLLTFTKYTIVRGTQPELYTVSGANPSLPGKRADTVMATATGLKSYVLHDYLFQAVGLIRFYDASSSNKATLIEM